MKKYLTYPFIIIAILLVILISNSMFIIDEYEQAVVTQFGRPVHVIVGDSPFTFKDQIEEQVNQYSEDSNTKIGLSFGAGLYFKTPFIQDIHIFEDRLLEYDSDPAPITSKDKKRLILDSFARWRISNPLLFKQTIVTIPDAIYRLDSIIKSALRNRLGEHDFIHIIRSTDALLDDTTSQIPEAKLIPVQGGRDKIMQHVTESCREDALKFGIYIVDVRIKRADLPDENLQSIFENMKSERQRIAEQYRQQGNRDGSYIKSDTDRIVKTMIAEAGRKAQALKGKAEADAANIYANGYIKEVTGVGSVQINGIKSDPEFYKFVRSLQALETSMDENTSLILNTENDLLRYLERGDN